MSRLRDELGLWLSSLGFAAEVPFPGLSGRRKWRWDWAKPAPDGRPGGVAVEWQGIMGGGASHLSVTNAVRDHAKLTEAQLCGWLAIQCNAKNYESGECCRWVERALNGDDAA